MVFNPEPHFRAISYPIPSEEIPPPPSIIHRPDGTGTIHPGNTFHNRTRASSSSTTHRVPPASSINPQQTSSSAHPDIRSTKRQRIAAMMETPVRPVRCGEAEVEPSAPAPPTPVGPVEPAAKTLPIATEDNKDTDSDQSTTPLRKASLAAANPAATARSSTTGEVSAPTIPGDQVDALNRPWPPCDDQELVNHSEPRLSYFFAHLHLLSSHSFSSLIFSLSSLLLFDSSHLCGSISPYCRKFDF